MIERIRALPVGIDGFKAAGKVSKEDCEQVREPLIDDARRQERRIRFLYHFGPELEGFTPGGAWEDAKIGFRSMRLFDGCAIVSDIGWIREHFVQAEVKSFGYDELEEAIAWSGAHVRSTDRPAGTRASGTPAGETRPGRG